MDDMEASRLESPDGGIEQLRIRLSNGDFVCIQLLSIDIDDRALGN
jgi:hypothetical protein